MAKTPRVRDIGVDPDLLKAEARVEEEQDRRQQMMVAGDALVTALVAVAGAKHVGINELIAKWDETKDG